jgi:trehalose/maltose hydrolase-like predicted phosphorylase
VAGPAGHAEVARLRDLGAQARAATIELAFLADTPAGDLYSRLRELWRIGIGSAEVVVVEPEPGTLPAGVICLRGGPPMLAALLEDQIARRRDGELPRIDRDPAWTLTLTDADPVGRRVPEGLLTLADGRLGTRGSALVANAEDHPSVLMAGVYSGEGSDTRLLDGPSWNTLALDGKPGLSAARVLNLRAGTLAHELVGGEAQLRALLLSSLARPATTVLRARGISVAMAADDGLEAPVGGEHQRGASGGCSWIRVSGAPGSILAARHTRFAAAARVTAQHWVLDRMTSYESRQAGAADEKAALDSVAAAADLGFDALFGEHRRAWANRWEHADIGIEGDPDMQFAVRLALFHLMASVPDHGEAAVGARGMSGVGYRGHVFWDSDVYVLPFVAATHPASARAMLEYRVRRLPASLAAARAEGRSGARFAWESAASGQDVTPLTAPDGHGGNGPVYSGRQEEHVVADVAWAAAHYIDWTGDEAFANGPGLELLVQTARWWASRIERDDDGSAHIRGVMGPDEYHEHIDDDSYTNVMARWNLRRAAGATGDGSIDPQEHSGWLELADAIVDGYDPVTGIYEQFAGFNALEPLVIADLAARRPVSADMLLGHARVRAAQIVKQPDVLMAYYLIPEELAHGSLRPNLDFYDPRTAHGSSLSPGVHAALMARAGHLEHALELLRLTTRIDLDDIGGEAEQGVHLAAMGSVWRAIALGFAGLRPAGDALAIDPVLPPGWESLKLGVSFQGSRIRVCVRPDCVQASADPPVAMLTPAGERVMLGRDAHLFAHSPVPPGSR